MIVKRLYLNMENWSVSRGSYQLGYIAENTVTRLQIATEIDPNCTYHLEQKINDESYILYLEKGDGVLTATIPNTMLTSVGNANWQIVGIWPDNSVKKSNVFNVYISNSINAENEVPASEITAFTEALADLAKNMGEVAEYAESASTSASNASISASEASESAESASASAESASTSAENASTSAENASTSAESASTYATNASESASEASTHATNASESATNASESASEANTSARNARTSASEASESAESASASAESASTSVERASASAESASNSATNASASAESANTSATNASASASEASISASEASTSAENAATSATNASASANEANTHASNASASATTATEQASLASSAATSAQTYAANASTSEQKCATYASNVYTKDETDALLGNKANTSDVYTKTESDTLLSAKANSTDVYTKTESDTLLNAKANTSDVYTKTQADTLLDGKVNVSDFEDLEADVESVMLYVGYDKEVAGLCADFENNTFTRIAGSVGKSAGTDFNSWNLFGGRRRCNVADDGTINAWYGDNDFVEDGSNGQVMVYQPKFYYRVEPLKLEAQSTGIGYHLKKANYYVSDTQKAGFKLHPAFIDKNGNEIDYILFSAYEGCLYDTSASAYITNDSQVMNTSEDKLSSIANVKPCSGTTQNLTRPNVETLAQNRGTNWHGETIQFVSVNQLLCAIEYASFDFQTAIGQGVISYAGGSGNEASNTGATSTLGNASGQATETTHVSSDNVTTIDTTAGKLSVSYRGVENIWGNIWKFEYGVNIWGDGTMNGGQPYICSDYNFAESKNSDNYVGAGFTVANEYGYVKYFGYSEDFDYLFIASRVGGTSSLPVGDYFYAESNLNAYRIARLGGCWFYGSRAGSFYWYLYDGVGFRDRSIGCRLAYTPTR